MRASFFILVSAWKNAGWFNPGWLTQPNLRPALEALKLTGDDVMSVFRRVFAADFAEVKRRILAERNTDPLLQRYDVNPLMETPFVKMPDGRYLAPSTHFVAQRLSPASLYYVGLSLGAQEFSSDLGKVTEAYVGEQLDLLDTGLVLHDVEYAKGQRAADYVVVLPGVTLVIEVKSARVARLGRLDQQGYLDDLNRDVGKALGQIARTGAMIRQRHPAFAQVDPSQEIRGVVVTAEPHYMLNSPYYRDQITDPGFSTVILSLSELEHAVAAAHAGRAGELFTTLTGWGAEGIDTAGVIRAHEEALGLEVARNPILDAAYERAWGDIDVYRTSETA
ncbi:nuclease-related domain-containing protein [Salinispora arenicola]|uniref:nuclease-related domain-containing protein n=1 Tax=Salinispora arenicola TaxID=168697 RepID=UPI0016A4B29E|nr:nuclease-related domain-containing protein [Salinispora arenicola]NIL56936.1 NERD domain-containing protein [Salinispora arenicola]NIL63066.1 NERD domain-containing protein [Salinispora arenicola]